jgi:hypothetical protein
MKKKEKENDKQMSIEELSEMAKEIQQKTKELNELIIEAQSNWLSVKLYINQYGVYGKGFRIIPLSVKTSINIK